MKAIKNIIIVCLIGALLAGCAHQIRIANSDIQAGKMKAGEAYIAPVDGWYVSDKSLTEMLMAMEYFRLQWSKCEER